MHAMPTPLKQAPHITPTACGLPRTRTPRTFFVIRGHRSPSAQRRSSRAAIGLVVLEHTGLRVSWDIVGSRLLRSLGNNGCSRRLPPPLSVRYPHTCWTFNVCRSDGYDSKGADENRTCRHENSKSWESLPRGPPFANAKGIVKRPHRSQSSFFSGFMNGLRHQQRDGSPRLRNDRPDEHFRRLATSKTRSATDSCQFESSWRIADARLAGLPRRTPEWTVQGVWP